MQDNEIINLYEKRSESAIEHTKIQYGKMIFSLIYHIIGNSQDTEECENDTYLGIWNSIPPQKPRNFKAYILKIARNRALKKVEYLNAAKRNNHNNVPFDELNNILIDHEKLIEEITESDLAEQLNEFLSTLNENNRKVFMLRYWYFRTIREIMDECNMSKSKVESILFRVRSKLREYLKERRYCE
ncbi:MAG: sigma-70 family RNA polymerase sigma factor [Lachnospiraceae bacterium]|nr:sigma-70 family RNA polymerase sigma factor [Lachnospiraceae bacterium]